MATDPQRRSLPPMNAVRVFEAAARHGSFKAAARELGVTHGAVSRHVALLEQWLGPPALFTRHNRKVLLTAAGGALLEAWAPALDRVAGAVRRHRGRAGAEPGAVLRVNALSTFSLRWLLPRLGHFRERHPAIEVRLITANDPIDEIEAPFDVIIRGGPDSFEGYSARAFLPEQRLPVCNPALLRRLPLERPEDLTRHTLLQVGSMPALWRDWLVLADVAGLEPAAELTFDHFFLSVQAALDGLGVAMGPTALVADDLAAGRLVAPFSGPSLPARTYCTYVPHERTADPAVVAFRLWLESGGTRDR